MNEHLQKLRQELRKWKFPVRIVGKCAKGGAPLCVRFPDASYVETQLKVLQEFDPDWGSLELVK
jgi:hypothetical protein